MTAPKTGSPVAELGGAEFCQGVLLLHLGCFSEVLFENGATAGILVSTIVHSAVLLLPSLPCLVGNSTSRSNQQRRLDKHDADECVRRSNQGGVLEGTDLEPQNASACRTRLFTNKRWWMQNPSVRERTPVQAKYVETNVSFCAAEGSSPLLGKTCDFLVAFAARGSSPLPEEADGLPRAKDIAPE